MKEWKRDAFFLCLLEKKKRKKENCWSVFDVLCSITVCLCHLCAFALLLPAEMSGWSQVLVQCATYCNLRGKVHVHVCFYLSGCMLLALGLQFLSAFRKYLGCDGLLELNVPPKMTTLLMIRTQLSQIKPRRDDISALKSRCSLENVSCLHLCLSPGDDTYHDIFRDFSHMASNNPEKLKRRSADPKS